jgi:hypothetical protein
VSLKIDTCPTLVTTALQNGTMGTVHLNQGAQKYQCMASVHQHQTPNNVAYKIEVCGFVEEESLRDIHSFWMLVTPF